MRSTPSAVPMFQEGNYLKTSSTASGGIETGGGGLLATGDEAHGASMISGIGSGAVDEAADQVASEGTSWGGIATAAMQVATTGLNIASSLIGASTDRIRAAMARDTYRFNAKIADIQATRVMTIEGQKEQQYMQQYGQVAGTVAPGYASQGVSSNSEVARRVALQTYSVAQNDIQRMHSEATNEAWGFKTQAQQQRTTGAAAFREGNMEANNTLLTGGISAARDLFKTTDYLTKMA